MTKKTAYMVAIACGAALFGCNGWPRAADYKQAEHKPEKYVTYTATAARPGEPFTFDNRRWMVEPKAVNLHETALQPVGSAAGVSIYAPKGEQAPYGALYTPAGGTMWRAVVPNE